MPERTTKLARIDPLSGDAIWVADIDNPWGWVAAGGGCCAYLNQGRRLQCFDVNTGEERWTQDLPFGGHFGHLLIADDVVVVGGWRGYTDLACLSIADGAERWRYATRGRPLGQPSAGPWGLALPFPNERRLELVDLHTGVATTTFDLPRPSATPDTTPFLTPLGTSLVATSRDSLFQLDPSEANARWRVLARHRQQFLTTAPAAIHGLLVLVDDERNLCGFDAVSGELRWSVPVHTNRADLLPVAGLDNDALAHATEFGRFMVLDADGEVRHAHTISRRVSTAMTCTSAGHVVVGTAGSIVAIAPSTHGAITDEFGPRLRSYGP